MTNWQPINTAPHDGRDLLTVQQGLKPTIAHWSEGAQCWTRYRVNDFNFGDDFDSEAIWAWIRAHTGYNPTHWTYLPEGPANA